MSLPESIDTSIEQAAATIAAADAILIGAGAGMGVDSGLPDFRGDQGFWKAYPPFRGKRFAEVSNPIWFRSDPEQAWGFFGHRLNLYRHTQPHAGFSILRNWAESRPSGYFVFTSNVDGQFQKAGFRQEQIVECHGSIHYLQCSAPCAQDVWPAGELSISVDEQTVRATSESPNCTKCQAVARPNILMFGDLHWHSTRCDEQGHRYAEWFREIDDQRLAIIEFGAGESVPTVRYECERHMGKLIRINPRDHHAPSGSISIPLGALDAIQRINALIE